jgi:hypothetical protein
MRAKDYIYKLNETCVCGRYEKRHTHNGAVRTSCEACNDLSTVLSSSADTQDTK